MILGVMVDTFRLYEGDDPNYELWLMTLLDRVYETRRREASK